MVSLKGTPGRKAAFEASMLTKMKSASEELSKKLKTEVTADRNKRIAIAIENPHLAGRILTAEEAREMHSIIRRNQFAMEMAFESKMTKRLHEISNKKEIIQSASEIERVLHSELSLMPKTAKLVALDLAKSIDPELIARLVKQKQLKQFLAQSTSLKALIRSLQRGVPFRPGLIKDAQAEFSQLQQEAHGQQAFSE